MEKLAPFYLENDDFEIHSLGIVETQNSDKLADELFELLGNDDILKYCPEMKIGTREEVGSYISGWEQGFQTDTQYSYFIYWKKKNSVIGEIVLLPPSKVKEEYNIEGVWLVQYVLNKRFQDHGIMTSMLRMVLNHLKGKVNKVGAICDAENIASVRILKNLNFKNLKKDGVDVEYYELNL